MIWGVPSLYRAEHMGPASSPRSRAGLHLRYLYIDRRLADDLPHVDSYFYNKSKETA